MTSSPDELVGHVAEAVCWCAKLDPGEPPVPRLMHHRQLGVCQGQKNGVVPKDDFLLFQGARCRTRRSQRRALGLHRLFPCLFACLTARLCLPCAWSW